MQDATETPAKTKMLSKEKYYKYFLDYVSQHEVSAEEMRTIQGSITE